MDLATRVRQLKHRGLPAVAVAAILGLETDDVIALLDDPEAAVSAPGAAPLVPHFFQFAAVAPVASDTDIIWQALNYGLGAGVVNPNVRPEMVGLGSEDGQWPENSAFVKLLEPGLWVVQATAQVFNGGSDPKAGTANMNVFANREATSSYGGTTAILDDNGYALASATAYIPLTQENLDAVPDDYPGMGGEAASIQIQGHATGGSFHATMAVMAVRLGDAVAVNS